MKQITKDIKKTIYKELKIAMMGKVEWEGGY